MPEVELPVEKHSEFMRWIVSQSSHLERFRRGSVELIVGDHNLVSGDLYIFDGDPLILTHPSWVMRTGRLESRLIYSESQRAALVEGGFLPGAAASQLGTESSSEPGRWDPTSPSHY